ncbi:MAG: BamA/TamA family outer membrane protein [Nitrospiria bacterium]
MVILALLLTVFIASSPVFGQPVTYDIEAAYDDETHEVIGREEISFTHQGAEPISELYLFLYPNLYLHKHPQLEAHFYRKAYPVAFNPAGIEIHAIADASGAALAFSPDVAPNQTIIKVILNQPLAPGEKLQLSVKFTTKIPEKWGPFGYYEDLTALQGGWHPYLANIVDGKWVFRDPPQESNYRIRLKAASGVHVTGSTPATLENGAGDSQTYLFEGKNLSFFSLALGRDFITQTTRVGAVDITYHALERDASYADQVIQLVEASLIFFVKRTGLPPAIHLEMVSAGLHQDLTIPGTNLLYVNHRLFKVFPTLKRFHEASLAYGLYRLLWRKRRPDEAWWVIECLAQMDAEAFMKDRHGKAFNLGEWLKPIAFIPLIDQILYSDALPMRQVYFKESVDRVVSEDIRFFNNPSSESPSIFSKLRNLLGDDVMDRTLSAYLSQDHEKALSFRKVLSKTSGQDLDWLIDRWLSKRTQLDFEIAGIQKESVAETHQTTIEVKKHGKGIEPLQVLVQEKNGSATPLVWDGIGDAHRFILTTRTPVQVVELDPHKLSNDPNRLNNRFPRKWKVLLDQFNFNYDFQTKFLGYKTGLLFQRVYDTRNWIRLRFSHTESGDSEHLSYTHTVKRNHLVTAGLTHTKTEEDLDLDQRGEESSFVSIGYDFVFPDVPLLPESVQRLTTTFPAFNVGLTFNQEFASSAYEHSVILKMDLRRVYSFSNYHEVAGRVFWGYSTGRLFEDNRFFLGGSNGMRGYTPLVFEGENMSLYSVEYRFPLFYETDINFLGLVHTHTWQGAIFSDAGMVTDSHNVFQFEQYKTDVGLGLRFFVDLFGVYPAILRADIARPISPEREDENKIHYYLNLGHSF